MIRRKVTEGRKRGERGWGGEELSSYTGKFLHV